MHKLLTLLPGVIEFGPVPEYFVTAITHAEILDRCAVRFTMASQCGGIVTPQCSLVWTIPQWIAARVPVQTVLLELETVAPEACLLARRGARMGAH